MKVFSSEEVSGKDFRLVLTQAHEDAAVCVRDCVLNEHQTV